MNAGAIRGRGSARIEAIDFWRGLVLIIIFINHMPGNIFGRLTPSNFGFSDSAEAFVFIAGLSVALAWGKHAARGAFSVLIEIALRRTFVLYAAHVMLILTAVALYANAFVLAGDERFLLYDGREIIFEEPGAAMVGILLLSHQVAFYNVLPLYVVLIALSPVILLATWRSPFTALMASIAIYVVAQLTPLNLPGWPGEQSWFFNPFAWQLSFVSGMVVGVLARRDGIIVPASRSLLVMAAAFVIVAAVVRSNVFGLVPGLFATVYEFGGLDKSSMSVMRFLHFLALAYLLTQLRVAERLLRFDWGRATALIGRHGLPVFALGSVLSSVGLIFRMLADGTPLESDLLAGLVNVPVGVMCLYWLARYLDGQRHPASAPTHRHASAT